ncbi:MAG TPA: thioredoxin domain-containing protein [Candidatus Acidoferrum sp.]|nr:thioredoxin domain-containing protein [Candidatus Acidoferrum sp.]
MKRRHLLVAAIALALLGATLSFGWGVNRDLAVRTGGEDGKPALLTSVNPAPAAAASTLQPENTAHANASAKAPAKPAPPSPTPRSQPEQLSAQQEVDPHCAFGSKTAPVTMEIYSDFQCPACKQLFKTTNQPLMDNYVNTGKVYLIHRDFPLPMHAYSRLAASYARAAAHIGKFDAVEQALFQNQEKWEANGDVKGTVLAVLSAADMKKVQALVDGRTLEPLIDKDKQAGQVIPVNQTPTTVFRHKGQTYPYAGVMSYDILKGFLDDLLSR